MQRTAFNFRRSRRKLSNAYLLAKFGFDTAENEPCKVCLLSVYRSPRCPENPQFWTIKKQNKAFSQKVMDGLPLAVDILLAVGFEDQSESLQYVGAADRQLLWDALAEIDLLLQELA